MTRAPWDAQDRALLRWPECSFVLRYLVREVDEIPSKGNKGSEGATLLWEAYGSVDGPVSSTESASYSSKSPAAPAHCIQ